MNKDMGNRFLKKGWGRPEGGEGAQDVQFGQMPAKVICYPERRRDGKRQIG